MTFGSSLLYVGHDAILACSSKAFSRVALPSSVMFVGASAFQCTGQGSRLECVVFGESLRSVGLSAFADCGDLAEMEVYCERPEGMDDAFRGVDLGAVRFYATSVVAGSWAGYEVELLDAVEEDEDNTMTYVVLGMVLFFIVAGALSVKYRTKFE